MTLKSTFIALTAAASMALALAPAAEAKTKVKFNVGIALADGIYLSANNGWDGYDDEPECYWKTVKKPIKFVGKKKTYYTKEKVWVCE
jgi:hypothetical protein